MNDGAGGLVPFLQPTPNEANALGRGGGGGGGGTERESSSAAASPAAAGGEDAAAAAAAADASDGDTELYQVGRRGELLPAPYSFAVAAFGRAAYSRAAWREASQLVGRLLGVGALISRTVTFRVESC